LWTTLGAAAPNDYLRDRVRRWRTTTVTAWYLARTSEVLELERSIAV